MRRLLTVLFYRHHHEDWWVMHAPSRKDATVDSVQMYEPQTLRFMLRRAMERIFETMTRLP